MMAKFSQKNEITELCKGVHCVDLGESFQTHIHLQNFVSIQPRTSPLKFAAAFRPVRRRALGDLAGVSCKELNPYSNGSLRSYIRASHQIRTSESRENENRNAMQSCEASSRKIAHSKI